MVLSCSSDAGLATPCLQALQCLRHLPLHWIITPLLGFDPIVAANPATKLRYIIHGSTLEAECKEADNVNA